MALGQTGVAVDAGVEREEVSAQIAVVDAADVAHLLCLRV